MSAQDRSATPVYLLGQNDPASRSCGVGGGDRVHWDDFRVEFDDDGTLRQRGRNGWREPVCPTCGEPIQWVLDMASFVRMDDGSLALAHARCAWTREAFEREAAALEPTE